MGLEYALVHLKYTIPPAIVLTLLYRPLLTRLDVYKLSFIVSVAVVSTIPWDAYLIRERIWTYPPDVIVGFTLFGIPAEELFFFVIQTYCAAVFYLLLTKPSVHSTLLRSERSAERAKDPYCRRLRYIKLTGQILLGAGLRQGVKLVGSRGSGTYMGLIIVWAGPFLIVLWSLAYQLIIGLPLSVTAVAIWVPTLYLWGVDTLALRRGTWVIESGTKLGIHLWDGLEIEEAVFFLATNTLVVVGLIAFDNALAILYAFPTLFPEVPDLPSPALLMRGLLKSTHHYDSERITGLQQATVRLRKKSRSFFIASAAFQGRLRIDLILLYSFCRAADDLVDNASSVREAREWITKLSQFLDIHYKGSKATVSAEEFVNEQFPANVRTALHQLPVAYLSGKPLYDLLKGFETDLEFPANGQEYTSAKHPIRTVADLDTYGARVAGTVAELCLELVYHHSHASVKDDEKSRVIEAGAMMGKALQYVNISRDITVDARLGRVYIPTVWLEEEDLTPADVLKFPQSEAVGRLRARLLERAFSFYDEARRAIEDIPGEARNPMRVAVESYMEIGRVLTERDAQSNKSKRDGEGKAGRATVPVWRRIRVAWRAMGGLDVIHSA